MLSLQQSHCSRSLFAYRLLAHWASSLYASGMAPVHSVISSGGLVSTMLLSLNVVTTSLAGTCTHVLGVTKRV